MDKCDYCNEEIPLPSRHEPNCGLNPYFQNRIYQLPREYLFDFMKDIYSSNILYDSGVW